MENYNNLSVAYLYLKPDEVLLEYLYIYPLDFIFLNFNQRKMVSTNIILHRGTIYWDI